MAKTKTTETVETTVTKSAKITNFVRKGALAYVGLHGAAYDQAKTRLNTLRGRTDGLFDTLVEKGADIEAKAGEFAKTAPKTALNKAATTFTTTTQAVRNVLPQASNDRVEELESEIASLTKKLNALTKKADTAAKNPKLTTEKTAKTAA